MNRNVILLAQFALVYLLTNFLQLWSLEMLCVHQSYIVYFEISVMPIGHEFSFFGCGKVVENQCWKRGGTLSVTTTVLFLLYQRISNCRYLWCPFNIFASLLYSAPRRHTMPLLY